MWDQMKNMLLKPDVITPILDKFIETVTGAGDHPSQDLLKSAMKTAVTELNRMHESGEYNISEIEGSGLLKLIYDAAVSMKYTGDMKFLEELKKW